MKFGGGGLPYTATRPHKKKGKLQNTLPFLAVRRDYTNTLLFNFLSHRHILNLNPREKQAQMKGKLHYEMEPFV